MPVRTADAGIRMPLPAPSACTILYHTLLPCTMPSSPGGMVG